MRNILVAAISNDEFITKGSDPNPASWTSKEDGEFFEDIKSKHSLIVMGSKTFESHDIKPTKNTLRVVLTSNPKKYSKFVVDGQLEFATFTPLEFTERYETTYKTCLILGGSYLYTEFLEAGLVDEMYITIEPVNNLNGTPLFKNNLKLDNIGLPSPRIKVLNKKGTVLRHYLLK